MSASRLLIALALLALLGAKGHELARPGSNGWSCFVGRGRAPA